MTREINKPCPKCNGRLYLDHDGYLIHLECHTCGKTFFQDEPLPYLYTKHDFIDKNKLPYSGEDG